MIRLDTVNRSLQLYLSGAITTSPLQIIVSYSDQTATGYLGATQLSTVNSSTPVTICNAPAANTIRDIDMISVLNTDSVSATLTIDLLDSSTGYNLTTVTLAVNEKLTYTHGSAWQVVTNAGNLKTTLITNTSGITAVSATTPLLSTGGQSPNLSIAQATTSTSGYLTSTDWNTFNNKISTLPTASNSVLGAVKIDNSSIVINGSGVISVGGNLSISTTISDTTQSTTTSTGALVVAGGVGIAKNATIGGTVSHAGLAITTGTNIDQVLTFTQSLTLTTGWTETGISANSAGIVTGSYMIQIYANDIGSGGTNNNEYYTGVMSWNNAGTNDPSSTPQDEIPLHRAGQGSDGNLYLRTNRTLTTITLQISSTSPAASASNYVFKFRRLI